MEKLAEEGTAPHLLAWARGPCLEGWTEARVVPPPLRWGQGTPELRLPARADKGPSQGSHKRFITGGGGQPAGLRTGHKHGAALGSNPGSGKTEWGQGTPEASSPGPAASQTPKLTPPLPTSIPPLSLPLLCFVLIWYPKVTDPIVVRSFPVPPHLFPQSHAHCAPHRKGCPQDPLRPSTSVWKAPSRGAWRRKTGRRWLSCQLTSVPWS